MTKAASKPRTRTTPVAAAVAAVAVSIAEFDSQTKADAGVRVDIVHPRTGLPSGAAVVVHGMDSERFRTEYARQKREMTDFYATSGGKDPEPLVLRANGLALLARCTSAFINLASEDGSPLDYSFDVAFALYDRSPAIREQVDVFLADRANFLKA